MVGIKHGSLKAWLMLPRFQFLPLTVILVSLGTTIAAYEGYFHFGHFLLAMIGSILVHMTVNVINDYHDYVDGIDLNTQRTPFSGGSGVLPSNLLKPKQAFWFATICLLIAMVIGVYFVMVKGWLLFPLLLIAGFSAYFYNVYLAKWLIGEIFAGLCFGPLLVLGSYYVQTGRYSWETLVASLAPGILTTNLLFLNEFPDWEADRKGGRRHFVISLGKKDASYLFVALLTASYLCIIAGVLTKMMPVVTLIGLGTIGFGWKAAKGALKYYDNTEKLVPILGANVITILGTQALLAVGYVIAMLVL
ncbi:MAG: prenyltransferase [Desulfobacterales bacterium]|jgi:1,4-dihydroxy-2-naphthoate octaprenyltransferase|nr:prenyltransferase [Desulfobacterales bacterium]